MATNNELYKIETIVVDGAPIAFVDGSARISGAARFENDTVLSATGDDFSRRKRVPTTITTDIQFGPAVDPATVAGSTGVQITLRDNKTKRRCVANKCSFGSMGEIGDGPVRVTWNVLAELQWL